jgi:predicted transcriptional regulator
MAQLAIYIDDDLARCLDKAVKASGKSKSKWVAEAIRNSLQDKWPDGFFDSELSEANLRLLREGVAEMESAIMRGRKNRPGMDL